MARPIDFSSFVRRDADGIARMDFAVEGMTRASSIGDIENLLRPLPGLLRARINYGRRRLAVEWSEAAFDPARIVEDLARIGYRATPFAPNEAEEGEARQARALLRCIAVAGFAAMNVMLLSVSIWAGNVSDITPETRDFFHWLSALIVLPAAAFAGRPFFAGAARALRARRLTMDVPISLGIALALGMSVLETARHAEQAYFDSAIMLIFFLLIGRYVDHAMRRKTRGLAANLAALRSPTASRIDASGEVTTVPAAALALGEIVLVRPGERIPVDGLVVSGRSAVDESLVTGETRHQIVTAGRRVYAGTLNLEGVLRVEIGAVAAGTLLDEIERLIESTVAAKSRYIRLADRVSRYYAPVVHLAALATALAWLATGASLHDAVVTAIAVLIVTCPCALALAVPTVQVIAAGALFRNGLLLNSADAIEKLAAVDTIVFDKTGTLTLPEPSLGAVGEVAPEVVHRAARLALASHHPLARSLAEGASPRHPHDNARESPGQGVEATIDGVVARLGSPAFCGLEAEAEAARREDPGASVIAFRHGTAHAIFLLRQSLRDDAIDTLAALRRMGLTIILASGDRAAAVEAVAEATGIERRFAAMRPGDKIALIEDLRGKGARVMMVGDGMNDAPALAAADVSLSPIGAADIAQAAADAVFLGERLAPVREALLVARRARALMRQNLALALGYNLLAVPLAMDGRLTPLIAAAAMSGSSILVTLNALRAAPRPAAGSALRAETAPNGAAAGAPAFADSIAEVPS